jgi:hypothetical protein
MNMKRKWINLLILLLLLAPAAVQAQFSFVTNADNTLSLSGYSGPGGNITIPSTNDSGLPVTIIGNGSDIFFGTNITSITIPASVTSISFEVFYGCFGLTNVIIGPNVASIGANAFEGCSALSALFIPNSMTNIADYAFAYCTALTNITVGTNVAGIEDDAFYRCTNLTAVLFQGNAPVAGSNVFAQDQGVTAYHWPGTTGWSQFSISTGIPVVQLTTTSLRVTITPSNAVVAGAQWQLDGGSNQNNGVTLSSLSAGSHTVSFTPISGWITPSNQIVVLSNGVTTTAIGVYTITNLPGNGSLQVNIVPAGAASAGAQWQLDGGSNQNSGATLTNLSVGNHTLSFTPISEWNTPSNQTVTATNGAITFASGIYTLTNPPSNNLILITNGSGTIQHGTWPASLVAGKKYTVKAVPKARNSFVNWIGGTAQPFSVLSSSANYTFTNQPNLLLEANFQTNFFLAAQGTYRGLFAPPSSARQQSDSGSFTFSVTSAGAVSGNLNLGGQTVPFSGKSDLGGAVGIVLKAIHGIPSLTISLQLDFAGQTVSGTISNASFTADLNGDRAAFSASAPATQFEGQYTLVIPGTNDPAAGPFGDSYGTVKVSASGNITLAGSLADGTPITQSSVVSSDGYWPLYLSLYSGHGSLWGWNYFTNHTITNASALSWINATNAAKTAVYRSGFTNQQLALTGGSYVSSQPLPSGLAVTLQETNPSFTITITNLIGNTNKLTLKTNKTTGVISGSFANPANSKQLIKVNGVILQNQTNAQGYFLATNQSGIFLLQSP